MNNILTFEDYKKMNIRQVESVIYRQFIEEDIKDEEIVNEGIIRNAINKASGKFIQTALADEIEKGKELEKSIKEALDGLNKGFDEIEKQIDTDDDKKSKSKLAQIEKVKEAIKAVQSQAFDTLTMIGSEGEIDFAGFLGSSTVAAAANFGILFSPIRSLFITRKAYKYFLGIIKQTIRRNLLIIQLNFDQFENLILQKSFENEDGEANARRDAIQEVIIKMSEQLCSPDSKIDVVKGKKNIDNMKKYLEAFKKAQDLNNNLTKSSPFSSLWQDQHNNTYTRTLEQIKQYINDDSQKELDSLKNSITKMAGNDVELVQYGELIISAAEEYAIHTNHGINNNFIKMSSVFNLDNQKKLIELIVASQKENQSEIERKKDRQKIKDIEEENKKLVKEGKKLYEEKLKDSTKTYTLDEFYEVFEEEGVESLRAFFNLSEEGKKAYEELIKKHNLYKYYIDDTISLNNLLSSINDLKIVVVSDIDDIYKNICNKEQILYNLMAEQSIEDAIKSKKSEKFFGFADVSYDKNNILNVSNDIKNKIFNNSIISKKTIITPKGKKVTDDKKRYFLTFNGSGQNLFDLLHKEFKTKILGANDYIDNISFKNKEILMQIIHKNLHIEKHLTSKLAEYLVRLEAHMLLNINKEAWFVVENNEQLFKLNCFKKDSRKIPNKSAFVEISQDDYADINKFLNRFHELSNNDFNINTETTENSEKKQK